MRIRRDLSRARTGRAGGIFPVAYAWHVRFARSATSYSTQDIRSNPKVGDPSKERDKCGAYVAHAPPLYTMGIEHWELDLEGLDIGA